MPNINDPKYKDLVHEQAQLFNKRSSWVKEMQKNENYPDFHITTKNSKALNRTVDCRDVVSMSSMLPLRGETEEEQKKNFQDDVYKMQQALFNGPLEETKKYIDMILNRVLNFDESKLDYSRPEDVFEAISIASMDQCFGTKKNEFYDIYKQTINTPELKEKFHYANIAIASYASKTYVEVEKNTHLDIVVTLFKVRFDDYANENADNITKRNVEQYQNKLQGKDEIVPLEFVMSPSFEVAFDDTKPVNKRSEENHIFTSVNSMLDAQFLAPNTDDGHKVSSAGISALDAIFVNGKPLDYYANEIIDLPDTHSNKTQKKVVYLSQKLADPSANIEICKLIPQGDGNFSYQYIPIHRNFSHLKPELQEEHNQKFNAFKVQNKDADHAQYDIHMSKKLLAADAYLEYEELFTKNSKDVPQEVEVGSNHPWDNHDIFYSNDAKSIDALNRINTSYDCINRFNKIYEKSHPGFKISDMSITEIRQGNGLAIFLSSTKPTDAEIYRKRLEIRHAFDASPEVKREFLRDVVQSYLDYKIPDPTNLKGDDLYKYLAFNYSFSIVTNILENDVDLKQYFISNPKNAVDLAAKSLYSYHANEYLAEKMIETRGTIAKGIVMQTNLNDQTMMSTGSMMVTTETKRLGFDLLQARINCETGNGRESTLKLPYFLSGNPLGNQTGDYSSSYSKFSVDQYINELVFDNDRLDIPSVEINAARIPLLALSTAANYYASLANFYSYSNDDVYAEFHNITENEKDYDIVEQGTFIDGKSLFELVEEKMNDFYAKNNTSRDKLKGAQYSADRSAYASAILAEALTNPERTIAQVALTPTNDNVIIPKVEVIKKDYSSMVKNATSQHNSFASFLHKIGLYTYPEEKTARRADEAYAKINTEAYKNTIANKFTEANKNLLLKHQAEYAHSREKQLEALKVVDPVKYQEKSNFLSDVRRSFVQNGVQVEEEQILVNNPSSRPTLEKVSKLTQQIDQSSRDDSLIENERFERQYKKQIEIPEEELNAPELEIGGFKDDSLVVEDEELFNDK